MEIKLLEFNKSRPANLTGKNEHVWYEMYDFPVHYCVIFHRFDNANGCLCQEELLRSRNLATMVT